MKTYAQALDALGDPTRRSIFETLLDGPAAVGTLAAGLPVSRPAVSQHLRVLKAAGLVADRQLGTRRIYAVEPSGVASVREYWERVWAQALGRFHAAAGAEAAAEEERSRDRDD